MTLFPTGLDSFNNPNSFDTLDTSGVYHDQQHANANDAIAAIQAKVGASGSAVTGSLDYRIRTIESGTQPTRYGRVDSPYSNPFSVDFNGKPVVSVILSGDIAFTGVNKNSSTNFVKNVTVRLSGDSVNRAVSFPGMCVLGVPPTGLLANKQALISFSSYGPNDGDTIVGFAAQA